MYGVIGKPSMNNYSSILYLVYMQANLKKEHVIT